MYSFLKFFLVLMKLLSLSKFYAPKILKKYVYDNYVRDVEHGRNPN